MTITNAANARSLTTARETVVKLDRLVKGCAGAVLALTFANISCRRSKKKVLREDVCSNFVKVDVSNITDEKTRSIVSYNNYTWNYFCKER